MKRIKTVLYGILIVGAACVIQGCSLEQINADMQTMTEIAFELSEEMQELSVELPIELEASHMSDDTEDKSEMDTEKENSVLKEIQDIYYSYHLLEPQKQKVYLEIYDVLSNVREDVMLSTTDKQMIDEVFCCVMNDHPELFYVEGYKCTEYSLNKKITDISFAGTYSMSYEEVVENKSCIEETVQKILEDIEGIQDEYYIVKYIYEYLINNTEYNNQAENNQNICSVFLKGESVCQGYAKALQYLLHRADMQCFLVTGFTNGERHAWNLVRVNGKYYYVDATWGDASYSYNGASDTADSNAPQINYDYFLVTTEEITRTHSLEKVVKLPECNSSADNYFCREGLLFDTYDIEGLQNVFGALRNDETDYITVKCSSKEVHENMLKRLISDKEIFDFLSGNGGTVAYTTNEAQKTISFWIVE